MIERRRANIEKTSRFLHVVTMSGRHGSRPDLTAFSDFLQAAPDNAQLGQAIRSAIGASRWSFGDDELRSFFDPEIMRAERQRWASDAATRFGFASVKQMDSEMLSLGLTESGGVITMDPTIRNRGGWTRRGAAPSRATSLSCADDEIGRIAMEALADCR